MFVGPAVNLLGEARSLLYGGACLMLLELVPQLLPHIFTQPQFYLQLSQRRLHLAPVSKKALFFFFYIEHEEN